MEMDEHQSVSDLKKAIKKHLPAAYECAAQSLQLYAAKSEDQWLRCDDPDVQRMAKGLVPSSIKNIVANAVEMRPICLLQEFEFPDEDPAEPGAHLHVLVELPREFQGLRYYEGIVEKQWNTVHLRGVDWYNAGACCVELRSNLVCCEYIVAGSVVILGFAIVLALLM